MYPIKFKPQLKENIWGGKRLLEIKRGQYSRSIDKSKSYGESWDISGVKGSISKVANGFLKGNNLQEIIEVYMGELVGEEVFEQFGLDFPLLIKNFDCNDTLSVQVHPNDELAAERHGSFGKREMVLYSSGAEYYIPFCEILYFESNDGKVYSHTARSVYTTDRKLFELEEVLPPSFVRIAKSTIANVDLVSSLRREMVGNGEMYFKNSEKKVYFSRSYYKTLRDKIQEMRLR